MKRVIALSCVLLAMAAAPARAEGLFSSPTPWSSEAEISFRVGLDYWHATEPLPMCGTLEKVLVLGSGESEDHFPNERGVSSEPRTQQPSCYIALNGSLPFRTMCSTAVFLVGHLVGQANSSDPASVMYTGWPRPTIPLCEDEALRLEGYGDIAQRLIDKARSRCEHLRREKVKKWRQESCRRQQARVVRANAKYLDDPY